MKDLLKKLTALGVVSAIALTLAATALAEDNDDRDDGAARATSTSTSSPVKRFRDQRPNLLGERKNAQEKLRDQRKEMEEKLKETKVQLQEKFKQNREEFKTRVTELKTDRKELQSSISDARKQKKEEVKNKVWEKAHKAIGNMMGAMVNRLEALKNKTEGGKLLEADRVAIVAEINKEIDILKAKQSQLGTASTTSTTTIKQLSLETKGYWDTVKTVTKRVSGEILAGRLNLIVSKTETLAATLTTDIGALKAKGADTAVIEAKLNDAKAKIPAVKQKVADAMAKFKLITTLENTKQNYEAGQALIKEAKTMLNEVHRALAQVGGAAKALRGGTTATTTPPVATTTATST